MARYFSRDSKSYLAIRLRLLSRSAKLQTTPYPSLPQSSPGLFYFHSRAAICSRNPTEKHVDYLAHASALPLSGPFSKLRAIELEASRDGGRNALDVLERINDGPQADQDEGLDIISKSIKCLQVYHDRLKPLSKVDAKLVLAADDAGARVLRWAWNPAVKAKIEGNHTENRFVVS